MSDRLLMIDLFSGLGGASQEMRRRGWEVVRVDLDTAFEAEWHVDVREFTWDGRRPDLVWASPPCTEFTRWSLPWIDAPEPSLDLVRADKDVIDRCSPRFWVLENVRGSVPFIDPVLGRFRMSAGPFFLWGNFPLFSCRVKPFKQRLSGRCRAERAKVPVAISRGVADVVESSFRF